MIKKNLVIEVTQWVLVGILITICTYLWSNNQQITNDFKDSKLSNNHKIEQITTLEIENSRLKKNLSNSKPIIIKYRYIYNGDTTYIKRKLIQTDSDTYELKGGDKDIAYNLKIKAKELYWYKLNIHTKNN